MRLFLSAIRVILSIFVSVSLSIAVVFVCASNLSGVASLTPKMDAFSWLPAAVAVHFVVLGIIVFLLAAILFFKVR